MARRTYPGFEFWINWHWQGDEYDDADFEVNADDKADTIDNVDLNYDDYVMTPMPTTTATPTPTPKLALTPATTQTTWTTQTLTLPTPTKSLGN